MEFTAEGILERMKKELNNEVTPIEGSFTMDNLQAVSEELARFHSMLIAPLRADIDAKKDDSCTSGNERHYIKWAKEVTNTSGQKIIGNARAYGVRDGSGIVYLSLISPGAGAPSEEEILLVEEYIQTLRPVGAKPIIMAAKAVIINISISLEVRVGINMDELDSTIRKKLTAYFAEIAFKKVGTVLNYHRIGSIINAIEGVIDVIDYQINEGEDSIAAAYDEYFKLEGLVLNA